MNDCATSDQRRRQPSARGPLSPAAVPSDDLSRDMQQLAHQLHVHHSSASTSSAPSPVAVVPEDEDEDEEELEGSEGSLSPMSRLCPLFDCDLPLDTNNIKGRQVEVALLHLAESRDKACGMTGAGLLRDGWAAEGEVGDVIADLEVLARLAWNDDEVRDKIAQAGGVRVLVDVLDVFAANDGVTCHACMTLMSLVRGEGDVCQSNQWLIAKMGAVESIVMAMRRFSDNANVQLNALLCLIPLVLDNAMCQAHITWEALEVVVAALVNHPRELDVQIKGLVLLGVLLQGDDVLHDALRQRQLEVDVPARIAAALNTFGYSSDDLLWAGLFVCTLLLREGSLMQAQARRLCHRYGLTGTVAECLDCYIERHVSSSLEPDDMIVNAAAHILGSLESEDRRVRRRKTAAVAATTSLLVTGVAAVVAYRWMRAR